MSWQQSHLSCSGCVWAFRVVWFVSLCALLLHHGPVNVIAPIIRTPIDHASCCGLPPCTLLECSGAVTKNIGRILEVLRLALQRVVN